MKPARKNVTVLKQISELMPRNSVPKLARRHAVDQRSRNGLSHANRERDADMAEELFWETLNSLQSSAPEFGMGRRYCGFPRRFRRLINVVDSTTIRLVANCMDWAKSCCTPSSACVSRSPESSIRGLCVWWWRC